MYLKSFVRRSLGKLLPSENTRIKAECPICFSKEGYLRLPDYYLELYMRYNLNYSISDFETLNIENYSCKKCGATDRDRLIALFLSDYLEAKNENRLKLLDFAPSKSLKKFIDKYNNDYKSADLYMNDVDYNVDIRDMKIFGDSSFDVFICSHVLEHIDDDIAAMKELYRIAKKGGVGILLVPIPLGLSKSVENEEYLLTEALRWKYFGQNDHVRMYSKQDFIERLEKVGFYVKELGKEHFGEKFHSAGITPRSVLYVVRKL